MYKIIFLFFLSLSPFSFGEEENETKYPYYELQDKIYGHHLSFDQSRWNSNVLFDAFIANLDPYKTIFNTENLSDISELRFYFNNILISPKIRNSTLRPLYKFYKQNFDHFHSNIKREISNVSEDYLNSNDTLFELKPEVYSEDTSEQNQRIKDFVYFLIIDKVIDSNIETAKKETLLEYTSSSYFLDYDEFNFLLLDTIANLMDPHSSYFSPIETSHFMLAFSGKLKAGVGVRFTYNLSGQPKISNILEGGPISNDGILKVDDVLTGFSYNGEKFTPFSGLSEYNIFKAFRGEVGDKMYISYQRNGNTNITSVILQEINTNQNQDERLTYKELSHNNKKYGYIKIPLFYDDFSNDTDKVDVSFDVNDILSSKGSNIDGLIIDLRDNGGGSLNASLKLLELFLDKSVLLQVKHYIGEPTLFKSKDSSKIFQKPLIVYINGKSASASEIFAGAIQDNKRGIIIGMPSYGKGTIQSVIDLEVGQVKLTTAQFFLPSGRSTQVKGIVPDILFPIRYPQDIYGEISHINHIKYAETKNLIKNTDIDSLPKIITSQNEKIKKHGFIHLEKYYKRVNNFTNINRKVPLNITLRKEELSHYYKKQIINVNNYLKANNKKLIKNKNDLIDIDLDLSENFNETAFSIFDKL
jgi:carboxyl-terminal processing protease